MSWKIIEAIEIVLEVIDFVGGSSAPSWQGDEKLRRRKKSKYKTEWVSIALTFIGSVILFSILKEPLPVQYPVQTIIIAALIAVFMSSVFCLGLYFLKSFYFRSVFSMLLFCCSLILFSTALVLWMYFKSGLF